MYEMRELIHVGKSEADLYQDCLRLIERHGIDEFWYHGVPVMIAIDHDTKRSASGKQYVPSDLRYLHSNSFLTIDLSLAINNHWGIYAESFVLHNGELSLKNIQHTEVQQLKQASVAMHQYLTKIAHPEMTFHELYESLDQYIRTLNVTHLDFRGNYGHAMVASLEQRIFIEKNVNVPLGDREFSFEPHLMLENGLIGYKQADVYCFRDSVAVPVYV
jgi:hypothetical protein